MSSSGFAAQASFSIYISSKRINLSVFSFLIAQMTMRKPHSGNHKKSFHATSHLMIFISFFETFKRYSIDLNGFHQRLYTRQGNDMNDLGGDSFFPMLSLFPLVKPPPLSEIWRNRLIFSYAVSSYARQTARLNTNARF